jgi:hypothetical protein
VTLVLMPWVTCVGVLVDSELGPQEVLIPELVFGARDWGASLFSMLVIWGLVWGPPT